MKDRGWYSSQYYYSEGSIQKFEPPKYHYKTMLIELQISWEVQ